MRMLNVLFGALLVAGMLALSPSTASADCWGFGYSPSQVDPLSESMSNQSGVGVFRAYGTTERGPCSTAYIFVWLDSEPAPYCSAGGSESGDGCYNEDTTSYVSARVFAPGCGSTYANGEHGWWAHQYQNGNFTDWETRTGWMTISTVGCFEPETNCWAEFWTSDESWHSVCSPIVIATGKEQSYRLTSVADGVLFDINGDGVKERTAWTRANSDDAFLAIDFNNNGTIEGAELIGGSTVPGITNGFKALAALQLAESGVQRGDISSDDPLYFKLLLWTDRNHNGVSEPSELRPFSEQFSAIGLAYKPTDRTDQHGNKFAWEGYVKERTKPGRNRTESPADNTRRHRRVFDVGFVIQ